MSRMRRGARLTTTALLLVGVASVWSACDSTNAVVGGSCAPGYTDCNGICVMLSSDQENCGTCGMVCASGSCIAGRCGSKRDASDDARADATHDSGKRDAVATDGHPKDSTTDAKDGATDAHDATTADALHDGSTVDGGADGTSPTDGSMSDGTANDGQPTDGSVDQCAPPYDTTASCGACGVACAATEVCAPVLDAGADAGTYACAPMCTPPLIDCSGTCIDDTSDPDNCGGCGIVCPSGICISSMCAGNALGDIVVIGHDYAQANVRVSEGVILANAVFLPPTNPLRVLSFQEYASASQVTNVQTVLKHAAMTSGRQITFTTVTDDTLVPADLASGSFDVLLVYDQPNAPASSLGPIGTAWQPSLTSFVQIGGDVVVLDGASGATPQMSDFLTSSNLLQTSAEVKITQGTQLFVVASGDAVGNFVVSPYAAQNDTVSFVTSEANGGGVTYVVDQGTGASQVPVVIHKTP